MFNEFTQKVHHEVYSAIDPSTTLSGAVSGKTVLVTGNASLVEGLMIGGGRGIGRVMAQNFAKAGARGVFLVSRTEEQLEQSQKIIKEEFPEILVGYYAGNIADEGVVAEIFRTAAELLGPLDVLVFHLLNDS
jgi:NAD(P)-dependent dehydrogenase (short-subunit alcohol dehydrogenase family)